MSVPYVQHEYAVSESMVGRRSWTMNSLNSASELVLVDGCDEELLVLDNSRLVLDDDYSEPDICRCDNCRTHPIANTTIATTASQRHSSSALTRNTTDISLISDGNLMDRIHDWALNPSDTMLEPSTVPYKQLNHCNGNAIAHEDYHRSHNGNSDHHNGHHMGHDSGPHHHWLSHCHPNQSDARHVRAQSKANRQLMIGCALCLVFMITELAGGFFSNSLAIMTDAAHLLSDLASFILSLFAIWISRRQPTKHMSFGYHRAEVLGAVTSILMIWILTGVLVYLAIERVRTNDFEIDSSAMLIVSGVGVVMNIVMAITLSDVFCCRKRAQHADDRSQHSGLSHGHSHASHGHSHVNMNVRAALIHVIGDLIQSVGVLIAALIIHLRPDYKMADPICTFIFSVLVMFTTYGIMRDAVYVLMEGFPRHMDYTAVKKDLMDIDGVHSVHSLHIWSLTMSRQTLSVHLAIGADVETEHVLKKAESLIRKKYDIQETTIQVERFEARTMTSCPTCRGPPDC